MSAKRQWFRRYRLLETAYTVDGERLCVGTVIYGEPWETLGGHWGVELTDSPDEDRPCTQLTAQPAIEPDGYSRGQYWR